MATEVKCIVKPDPKSSYTHITHIGGNDNGFKWQVTREQAIAAIKSDPQAYYTLVGGQKAYLTVVSRNGVEHLRTEVDSGEDNNLLSLPQCPAVDALKFAL